MKSPLEFIVLSIFCSYFVSAINLRPFKTIPVALNFLFFPFYSNAAVTDPLILNRYLDAQKELIELDTAWDLRSSKGGDEIRRMLGTVYSPPLCSSPLCSFDKFSDKMLIDHGGEFDLEKFDGPNLALLDALNQANMWAYAANFAGPEQKVPPEQYIKDSRIQVKRAILAIKEVIDALETD